MMFRPRWPSAGPMGGEGFAFPAGTWSLIRPTTFFATVLLLSGANGRRSAPPSPSHMPDAPAALALGLLYLPEIQFHRRRAAEDQHGDADLALLVVHFFHVSVEIRERSFRDSHRLAHFEQNLGLRLLHTLLHLVEDVLDFLVG